MVPKRVTVTWVAHQVGGVILGQVNHGGSAGVVRLREQVGVEEVGNEPSVYSCTLASSVQREWKRG